MLANSVTSRLAPPTWAPSTLGSRINDAMLPDLTENDLVFLENEMALASEVEIASKIVLRDWR